MEHLPVSLPSDLYEWLRAEAFARHVPMTQIVRDALEEHRLRKETQLRLPLDAKGRV